MILVPPGLSVFPVALNQFIDEAELSVWYSVPSVLSSLVERGNLAPGRVAAPASAVVRG